MKPSSNTAPDSQDTFSDAEALPHSASLREDIGLTPAQEDILYRARHMLENVFPPSAIPVKKKEDTPQPPQKPYNPLDAEEDLRILAQAVRARQRGAQLGGRQTPMQSEQETSVWKRMMSMLGIRASAKPAPHARHYRPHVEQLEGREMMSGDPLAPYVAQETAVRNTANSYISSVATLESSQAQLAAAQALAQGPEQQLSRAQARLQDVVTAEQQSLLHKTWNSYSLEGSEVYTPAISPNGDVIAIIGADRILRLLQANNLQPIATQQYDTGLRSVSFSPVDGSLVLGTNRGVDILNPTNGTLVRSIAVGGTNTVQVLADGNINVLVSDPNRLVTLDPAGNVLNARDLAASMGTTIIDPQGNYLVYGSVGGFTGIGLRGQPSFGFDVPIRSVLASGAVSPDGRYFVAATDRGNLTLADTATNSNLGYVFMGTEAISIISVRFVAADRLIAEGMNYETNTLTFLTCTIENNRLLAGAQQQRQGRYKALFTVTPGASVALIGNSDTLFTENFPVDGTTFYTQKQAGIRQEIDGLTATVTPLRQDVMDAQNRVTGDAVPVANLAATLGSVHPDIVTRLHELHARTMDVVPAHDDIDAGIASLKQRINALDAWTLSGRANRMQELKSQGDALKSAADDLKMIPALADAIGMFVGRPTSTWALTHMSTLTTYAKKLDSAIDRWQKLQAEFDATPWGKLSLSSLQRLFPAQGTLPIDRAFSIARMSGTNVTLAVRRVPEAARAVLVGGGVLSSWPLSAQSGGGLSTTTITMDPRCATGAYPLNILQADGTVLHTIQLHWNRDSRTLALGDAHDGFMPTTQRIDDGTLAYADLFRLATEDEAHETSARDAAFARQDLMSAVSGAVVESRVLDNQFARNVTILAREGLANIVNIHGSPTRDFLVSDTEFPTIFYNAFPHWREENRQQTMQNMHLSSDNFDYVRAAEFAAFWTHTQNFNNDVMMMIQYGMDAVLCMRRGDDPSGHMQNLSDLQRANTGYAGWLGLQHPDATLVLFACNEALAESAENIIAVRTEFGGSLSLADERFIAGIGDIGGTGYEGNRMPTPEEMQSEQARQHLRTKSADAAEVFRITVRHRDLAQMRGDTPALIASLQRGVAQTWQAYVSLNDKLTALEKGQEVAKDEKPIVDDRTVEEREEELLAEQLVTAKEDVAMAETGVHFAAGDIDAKNDARFAEALPAGNVSTPTKLKAYITANLSTLRTINRQFYGSEGRTTQEADAALAWVHARPNSLQLYCGQAANTLTQLARMLADIAESFWSIPKASAATSSNDGLVTLPTKPWLAAPNTVGVTPTIEGAKKPDLAWGFADSWFNPQQTVPLPSNMTVRSDSPAGRIFLGLIQQMSATPTSYPLFAQTVSTLTGIPLAELEALLPTITTSSGFMALKTLFLEKGYGAIFLPMTPASSILTAATGKTEYNDTVDGDIVFRVNMLLPQGRKYTSAKIYLLDGTGAITPLKTNISNALAIRVPFSEFVNQFPTADTKTFKFRLELSYGTTAASRTIVDSNSFTVESVGLRDLSTTEDIPAKAQQRLKENAVLNQVFSSWPLQGNGWRNTIASDYHLGAGRNAVDLNKGQGDQDLGEAVFAVAGGEITGITENIGAVKIKHSTVMNINGQNQTIVWYTNYLHMPIQSERDSAGRVIKYFIEHGDFRKEFIWDAVKRSYGSVNAGDQFGVVGKQSPEPISAHLHFEVIMNSATGNILDLQRVIEDRGIPTKAWDGRPDSPEKEVQWDEEKGYWMNNANGLAFVREGNAYSADATNVWIAWHEDETQRTRVIWKRIQFIDDSGQLRNDFVWVMFSDQSKRWTGTQFVDSNV